MTYQTASFIFLMAILTLNYVGWTVVAHLRVPGSTRRYWPMHLVATLLMALIAAIYTFLPRLLVYGHL